MPPLRRREGAYAAHQPLFWAHDGFMKATQSNRAENRCWPRRQGSGQFTLHDGADVIYDLLHDRCVGSLGHDAQKRLGA